MKPTITKWCLILISILFLGLMLGLPLVVIIVEALRKGIKAYALAVADFYTLKAISLTFISVIVAVVMNTIFGLLAAWTITKYSFKGKNLLITLIDLPFAISPVISGLAFILTFGRNGLFHSVLTQYDIQIVFAVPGIILATVFVTFPFIARELIPLMAAQGTEQEEAAAILGAKGLTIFTKVTLPNIKWGLLYGVTLCMARAMGEFGAVSVVSGHIRGLTNTLPLHIEILYNEYQFSAAFAVASLLMIFAVVILIVRNMIENKEQREV